MKKYFKVYYFIFILISSVNPVAQRNSLIFAFINIFISFIIMLIYKINIERQLIKMIFVWSLFVVVCAAVTREFQPSALVFYPSMMLNSFILVKLFDIKLFELYLKSMIRLSIISLIGWSMIFISLSLLVTVLKPFDITGTQGLEYYNVIFFTLHHAVFWDSCIARNAGFAWEPGPFGVLLVLAIFFNNALIVGKKRVNNNIILIITIVSTFSTTAIMTLFFYTIHNYRKKIMNPRLLMFALLFIVLFVYSFLHFDFLGEKVFKYSKQQSYVKERNGTEVLSGSRLVGFPIVLQDLRKNPLIGKGLLLKGNYEYFGNIVSVHLNTIFTILSSMGLFGFFFWYYFIVKSSKKYKQIFGLDGSFGFLIIISAASFGFNLHVWSIVFCFVTFGYFYTNDNKRNFLDYKEV